jgi:SpoVK/Ycf46/Vps4 family AAA+-type ATPase
VRYAELESRWVGQTSKHVAAVFRSAAREDAVLFFDEADAIASRRFSSIGAAYEREANAIVNVLLHELESFPGVVIFATNLAANIDPAFERRIRTHILFEMPDVEERERIWSVQLHSRKTPLAPDVDFRALAVAYPRSGGDIKNAVLKAAQIATMEPGPDSAKRIHQHHFIQGMAEVMAAENVMSQSLFDDAAGPLGGALGRLAEGQEELRGELGVFAERLEALEHRIQVLNHEHSAGRSGLDRRRDRVVTYLALGAAFLAAAALALSLLQ